MKLCCFGEDRRKINRAFLICFVVQAEWRWGSNDTLSAMMTSESCDISLVVPCYKDAPHLAESLDQCLETLRHTRWSYELILVNDASPDRDGEIIDQYIRDHPQVKIRAIHHEKNTGRGRAVMDGIQAANGTYVGFIDIDLEVHCRYIPSMIQALEGGADVVAARRVYKLRPAIFHRVVLSAGYVALVNWMLKLDVEDTEAGYKFFRRERILPVLKQTKDTHWFWDTEIIARSECAGLKIAFIPALFLRRADKYTTVRLLPDMIKYFGSLWRFRTDLAILRAAKLHTENRT